MIEGPRNIGFGAGHNRILKNLKSDIHLIINPDVIFQKKSISLLVEFLGHNSSAVAAGPEGLDESGQPALLPKRYPSILALAIRGSGSAWLRNIFMSYLARYEYAGLSNKIPEQVELLSGCCIAARTPILKTVGGFDERFFLYFEDFDLAIRLTTAVKPELTKSANCISTMDL